MRTIHSYLIRACYDWILDNNLTPYVLVDALFSGVQVPPDVVREGKVVLNLSPVATFKLDFGRTELTFLARFSGKSVSVFLPIRSILALYAQETGAGVYFSGNEIVVKPGAEDPSPPKPPVPPVQRMKPQLRRVK